MSSVTENSTILVNPYIFGNTNQQWQRSGARIQNRLDKNKVFDVAESLTSPGARVCAWIWSGGPNQKWSFPGATQSGVPHKGKPVVTVPAGQGYPQPAGMVPQHPGYSQQPHTAQGYPPQPQVSLEF